MSRWQDSGFVVDKGRVEGLGEEDVRRGETWRKSEKTLKEHLVPVASSQT